MTGPGSFWLVALAGFLPPWRCKRRDNPEGVGAAFAPSGGSRLFRLLGFFLGPAISKSGFSICHFSKNFNFSFSKIFYRFSDILRWKKVRTLWYKVHHLLIGRDFLRRGQGKV